MILATVGTQLAFPRLLRALDRIAGAHALTVVAQTCLDEPGLARLDQRPFLAPAEFAALAAEATVIVGHAGIGTIISADRAGRPLILFPRRASLGEHRNEHQLATARVMAERPGIHVAWDEDELQALLTGPALAPLRRGESRTLPRLLEEVAAFVAAPAAARRGGG